MLSKTQYVIEILEIIISKNIDIELQPQVKNLFSEYLVVVFYSEIENEFLEIIKSKINTSSDKYVAQFISKKLNNILKRTSLRDLKDTISHFDESLSEIFVELATEEHLRNYENFISSRHAVAHKSQAINTTFEEIVKNMLPCGRAVLEAFKNSLNPSKQT